MGWFLLTLAIVLEVCGTTCMKLSQGFTKMLPSVLMFVFYIACFTVFTFAVKKIEISTAYAIWCAVGIALIAVIGMVHFQEAVTALKVAGLLLVVAGVVALKFAS
ncbi:MAG TPA: multidrug efflux SMR transporter [Verrucomicrobiota bacterium]|jgi:small multidrug resistance pump|nr:multidrug efflux SMR transporter [Verrucomicrobiota bacterium]OQB88549.1 MAG: Multidrug resistance protein EbrB [Verrucomicrobia bacterium ADurb.Bin118]HPY31672.1 multidrug efflux SMR transporter [Verrucomicrobiota bacterium]HQB17806.1 multidrug efflux SMR transporter [Verrucomicrobiota bacterium]